MTTCECNTQFGPIVTFGPIMQKGPIFTDSWIFADGSMTEFTLFYFSRSAHKIVASHTLFPSTSAEQSNFQIPLFSDRIVA